MGYKVDKVSAKEPIVEEPDDSAVMMRPDDIFGNFGFGFFGNFLEREFKNWENLDGGYREVRTYSSFKQYENGKIVKQKEDGAHYVNDNGTGFVKTMKRMPDGSMIKNVREFDGKNLGRIKN